MARPADAGRAAADAVAEAAVRGDAEGVSGDAGEAARRQAARSGDDAAVPPRVRGGDEAALRRPSTGARSDCSRARTTTRRRSTGRSSTASCSRGIRCRSARCVSARCRSRSIGMSDVEPRRPRRSNSEDCKLAKTILGLEKSVFGPLPWLSSGFVFLAELTSGHVELPIFDRTGLTGRWTATLYFAPSPGVGTQLAGAPDPFSPSALQEQFGLKLEPTRGPVDVLVVDSVRQPTEN